MSKSLGSSSYPRGVRGMRAAGSLAAVVLVGLLSFAGAAVLIAKVLPRLSERDAVGLAIAAVLAVIGLIGARLAVILSVLTVLFSALIRRLFPAVDAGTDLLAITPFIVLLPLVSHALKQRQVPRTVLFALVVFAVSAVSVPGSGVPALVNLSVPILAGIAIRCSLSLQRTFAHTWLVGAIVAFGYGFEQFFDTPSWDAQWLINANFITAGIPGTPDFRPFATLPSPGTAAFLAVVTLLMAAFAPIRWKVSLILRTVAIGVTLPFIAISGVRSAWLFGGAAVIVGLITGLNRRIAVPAIVTLAAAAAAVTQVPEFASTFTLRAQTFNAISSDTSFQARSALLSNAGDYVSLLGSGLGTASNANRNGLGGLDNGYVVVLAESGLLGLVALALLLYGLLRGTSLRSAAFVAFWFLSNMAGYNFGNSVAFALVACFVIASDDREPDPAEEEPVATRRSVLGASP